MAIKSVGYPVVVDTGSDDGSAYSIFIDGNNIFNGRSIERNVDIAPILRDYVNSERIILDWPVSPGLIGATEQLFAGVAVITGVIDANRSARIYVAIDQEVVTNPADGDHVVLDIGGEDGRLYVANDYNENCAQELPGYPYATSVFIRGEVDHRQICFFGGNTSHESMTFRIVVNGNTYSKAFNNPSVVVRTTLGITEDQTGGDAEFSISSDQGVWDTVTANVVPCSRSRYALYAVNRMGGVTHLLIEGKVVESFSRSEWDISTNYDRTSHVGRGIRRMSTQIVRKWRLNTGYMSEADATHIDDLINSPRIVLHDMTEGRLFAVNSSDKTIERKTRRGNNNKPIEYALNFEEARTEIRR